MHKPLLPMFFPVLGAHVSASKFKYPDNTWKELCGMMANLVGDSGCNKGQFSNLGGNKPQFPRARQGKNNPWLLRNNQGL